MSADSIEKASEMFAETNNSFDKGTKPKYEHDEGLEFGEDFDFDGEFAKYAAMGEAEKQSGTFMTNLKRLEFPLHINPDRMVTILGILLLPPVSFPVLINRLSVVPRLGWTKPCISTATRTRWCRP